jgi:polyhydroxyalkanoate synthase
VRGPSPREPTERAPAATAQYACAVPQAVASAPEPATTRFDAVDPPVLGANAFVGLSRRQVAAALGRLLQRVVVEPGVAAATALDAGHQLIEVAIGRSEAAPAPGDKRFAHPAWSSNPLYHRLLQAYLVGRHAVLGLVDEVDLDPKSRERARFAVSLMTEAAAPTNTLAGNPSALAKAFETRGGSLVTGLRHFARDARHNGGMPSTVDTRPFTIGGNLAVTPGEVVHRSDVFELIQYAPSSETSFSRPLVAIPPQINKYYITDIAPGRSLIEHTVAAGVPYFAVSWRNPTAAQRDWNLETYVLACKEAVQVAGDITGSDDANVLGICAGGITMACLLGHLAATGEELVNSATFMVAGLDTSVESTVGMLASNIAIEAARNRSQRAGVLDGNDLAKVFAWLRPNDLVWNYWVNNYLLGQNPPAFDILYWNADTTRLPAGLHSDFLDLFRSNGLANPGVLEVLGNPVDLGKVTCDAYVVAGSTDHIVPWTGAYRTTQLLGGETEFLLSSSGHIQAMVNPPTSKKSSYMTRPGPPPPGPDEWAEGAERHPGTWWDHWTAWLMARSGDERDAPDRLGNAEHPPIEPAPGRYVHLQ